MEWIISGSCDLSHDTFHVVAVTFAGQYNFRSDIVISLALLFMFRITWYNPDIIYFHTRLVSGYMRKVTKILIVIALNLQTTFADITILSCKF